jgi:hypothetical protein
MRLARTLIASTAITLSVLGAGAAGAAELVGSLTADNSFQAYISTDPDALGTEVASGGNWQQAISFSEALAPGQTYYIHVIADNEGGPASTPGNPDAFLGGFTLTGGTFSNGTTSLVTNTTDWSADPNPVGEQLPSGSPSWTNPTGAPVTPVTPAGNGADNIWDQDFGGPIVGIPGTAQWIWSSTDPTGEAFFSTTFTTSAAPEPSQWLLFATGILGIGGFMRTSRRTAALRATA